MRKVESVAENVLYWILGYFEVQTDQVTPTRRTNLVIVKKNKKKKQTNKRTCRIVDFAVPTVQRVKLKESEKGDKYRDLARELKKYGTWKWWWYWW